jgi:hypothetical protein
MNAVHRRFISASYGSPMTTRRIALLIVVALGAAGCGTAHGSSKPKPARFTAQVTNPWFPLLPGSIWVYGGVKDGQPSREVMRVTRRTKTISGAPCVVVSDLLYLRGRLEERTTDFYTQDAQGNVWYFGENTAELDRKGRVKNTSGSWRAGVDGAKAGLFMFAHPRPGRSARQEFYKGEAEDHFRVLRLGASVAVPFVSSRNALLTKEWTPLEPGVIDHKYYLRGIGTVLERTAKGPLERNELVSFRRGS